MNNDELIKFLDENPTYKDEIIKKAKNQNLQNQVENIINDMDTSNNEYLKNIIPSQEKIPQEKIQEPTTPTQIPTQESNSQAQIGLKEKDVLPNNDSVKGVNNYDEYYNKLSEKYNISIGDLRNLHKENDYKDLEKIPGLLDNVVLEQGKNDFKPIKEVLFSEVGRVRQSTNNQEFYGLNQNETKKILNNLSSNYEVDESEVIQLYNNYVEKKVLNEQKYLGVKDFLKEQNNIDEDEIQDIRAKTDLVVQETFKDFVNIGNAFLNDDKSSINELNEKKEKSIQMLSQHLQDNYGYSVVQFENGEYGVRNLITGKITQMDIDAGFWKKTNANKYEILGSIGGAFAGAHLGGGVGLYAVANAAALAGANLDLNSALNYLNINMSSAERIWHLSNTLAANLTLDLATMGAGKGLKVVSKKVIPGAGKGLKVVSKKVIPSSALFTKAKKFVGGRAIGSAKTYAKDLQIDDDVYEVLLNANEKYKFADLSNLQHNQKTRERMADVVLTNTLGRIGKREITQEQKEILLKALISEQGVDNLIEAVQKNISYAPLLEKNIIGAHTRALHNFLGQIKDSTSEEEISKIIFNNINEIKNNYTKVYEKIKKIDKNENHKVDIKEFSKLLNNFLESDTNIAHLTSKQKQKKFFRGFENIVFDDKHNLKSFNANELIEIRKELYNYYYSNTNKGALKKDYKALKDILDSKIYDYLEKLETSGHKELAKEFKAVNDDYHFYKSVLLDDTIGLKKTINDEVLDNNAFLNAYENLLKNDIRDKSGVNYFHNFISKLSDEQRAKIEFAIIERNLSKNVFTQRLSEVQSYAYDKIADSLKGYNFLSQTSKDAVELIDVYSKFFANDIKILKAISKDATEQLSQGISQNPKHRFFTMLSNLFMQSMKKYMFWTDAGKKAAFQYHILQGIKHSKSINDFNEYLKTSYNLAKDSKLAYSNILKEMVDDTEKMLDIKEEIIKESTKGRLKKAKEKKINLDNVNHNSDKVDLINAGFTKEEASKMTLKPFDELGALGSNNEIFKMDFKKFINKINDNEEEFYKRRYLLDERTNSTSVKFSADDRFNELSQVNGVKRDDIITTEGRTAEPNSGTLGDTRKEPFKTDTRIRENTDERLANTVSKQLPDTDLARLSEQRNANSVNATKAMDDTRYDNAELASDNRGDLSTATNTRAAKSQKNGNERFRATTDTNRLERDRRVRQQYARSQKNIIYSVKLEKEEIINHLANKKAKQKITKDLSDENTLNESIKEAKEQRTLSEVAKNYDGGINKANINTNIQSLKLLKELEDTNRLANEEEQRLLASFSGFGKDAQKVFSEDSKYLKELKEFLDDSEIEELKRATLDAYFTPTAIVNNMYEIMKKQGLNKGDLILEPSVGLGAFVRGKSEYSFNLVELNPLIAKFTKQLYPSSKLINDDYIKTTAKANFILANPPYGNIKTFYKNEELNIHNAFVKKMIDDLNDGGTLGMIITHSFVDNMDNAMKEFLYKNADFVTMMKVPNKAFKDTEVNTDIIFLKKGTGQNIDDMLNNFYEKYPQNLLGASKSQKTNQYGKLEDYFSGGALDKAYANDGIKINLDDVKIYEYEKNPIINKELDQPLLKAREYYNKNADEVRSGEVYVKDNKVYFNDSEIKLNELDKTRKSAYKKFIELYPQIKALRTTLNSLREAELSDAKLDTINLLRTKLNHDYDVLAKKLKNDNIFNSHALKYGLENDAYAYELKALISYDEKTKKYYKNDIFHKRVFNPIRAESKPETIVDAFYYNQNKNYAFSSKSLSELLDNKFSANEIEKELLDKELILKNHKGELIDTNELLSGDLLEKIADFKNAKTLDEYQAKTLEKLENALPERIKIDDISFSMNSNIIKEKYIKDFFSDTYKANIKEIIKEPNTSKIDIIFSELGEHKLFVDDLYKTYDISDFADIILNNKQVIAQKYINKELVVSDTGTQALKGIISDIKLKFDSYIRSNYANEIEESVYKLNAKINKSYENSHISIAGMNADISLYEHQKSAVARVLDNKATFIAHEMGLGKTMSIASSVMKLKEVGKANRSMIITPKAVVGQFANEFKFLYPNSKILMIDKFDKANRLRTLNMMKYNDFDVCIISHDNFKNIKINAEYEASFIRNEIQELKDTIERIKKRDNENINIKNLQLRMENAEAKLKNRLEIANNEKDNVFFDDLGIDALFVDEAHKFKNMSFYSSFKNLKGLGSEKASDIAYDMYIKTSFLRDNDKNIVFATGTPLSNSITELYSYMRMLKPELLGEYNIHSLDDFVNTFAKVETVLEPNAKNELVEATRITDIVNIKTLKNMLFNVMDYVSNKELKEFWQERAKNGDLIAHDKLRRLAPNIEHIEVAIEPTSEHKARNRLYASFYNDLQNGKDHALAGLEHYKKMYEENRLNEKYEGKFSSDKVYVRKLAANGELNAARMNDSIDIRINGGTLDDENSKINTAVKNIINTAKEWQKDKGTQIVFLDKSNAMQDEIRQKLIKSSEFKESEIINIRDFDKITNENKRNEEIAKALQKMQDGEVRVLIGSRQKLGAGVNVQKRIVALHNIDAPWNAADYMQALGRAERQGNELNQIYDNFSVKSYNYVLKESFDAKVYDILKHKQNISRTFFAKDSNLNSAENFAGDIPFETMSNLANGNELATKMHELMKQRATLLENKAAIEAANTNNEQMLSKNQALFSKANKTQKLIKSLDVKEDENVLIGSKEYPKNSDTNKLIKEHLRSNQHSHDFLLSYDGVNINYQRKSFNKYELFIYDKIDGVDTRFDLVKEFSLDDNTNILQRLKNSFAKFDDIVKEQGEMKYNALKKINEAKEYKVQVFNDDEKITKLNNEIAELKAEIERQVKAAKEQAFNEPAKEEVKSKLSDDLK
ncbi:hypothetical protein AVCANL277_06530 [Campylobacter canadensis]|uniref:SNF2-related protein n=1 Tax=Campylobacter canadensis TaxID=449520 RepID=UPI001CCB32F7|nr:SNF2-related protein [Campylobacter canadensis]MBZ8000516.1 hypothetical protein [Campylobacter canadensis]